MSLILHVPILIDPKLAMMGLSISCPMDEIYRIAMLSDLQATMELENITKGDSFPWDEITEKLCTWRERGLAQESMNEKDFVYQWRTLWADRQDWGAFSNIACQRGNLMKLKAAKGILHLILERTDFEPGCNVEKRILESLFEKEKRYKECHLVTDLKNLGPHKQVEATHDIEDSIRENVAQFENFDGVFDDFNGIVLGKGLNKDEEDWVQENTGQFEDDEICGEVFLYEGLDKEGRKTSTFGSFAKNGSLNRPGFIVTWEKED